MFYIIYIIEVITNTVMICTMLQVGLQKAGKKDETPAPVDGDETIKIATDETLVNQAWKDIVDIYSVVRMIKPFSVMLLITSVIPH